MPDDPGARHGGRRSLSATAAGPAEPHTCPIADRYEAIVCDIDGVLARGRAAVEGAPEVLRALRRRGLGLQLVTNNASRTAEEIVAWLDGLGFDVAPSEVLTSSQAAAALLAPGTRCLVVGTSGLTGPLRSRGCVLVDHPAAADAVVVGIDPGLTYDTLRRATQALHRGVPFVATNTDPTFPAEDGLWPGNGAVVAFLEVASGRTPQVAGKPHRPLFDAAAAALGHPRRVLMVGDRLETDIIGAQAAGWDTALVLTGVTGRDEAEALDPPPTYLLDHVGDLLARA